MGEHLSKEEETRTCFIRTTRLRPTTGICHTTYHPQLPNQRQPIHPRSSLGHPYKTQGLPYQLSDARPQIRVAAMPPSNRKTDHPHATRSSTQSSSITNDPQSDHLCVQPHTSTRLPIQSHINQISAYLPDHQPAPTNKINAHLLDQTYHQIVYKPDNLSSCLSSTSQTSHPMSIYQPAHLLASTIHINLQMCAYQPDHMHLPRPTQICCCCLRGHLIQQQHGHYFDLKPNSPRSGDDWPD